MNRRKGYVEDARGCKSIYRRWNRSFFARQYGWLLILCFSLYLPAFGLSISSIESTGKCKKIGTLR